MYVSDNTEYYGIVPITIIITDVNTSPSAQHSSHSSYKLNNDEMIYYYIIIIIILWSLSHWIEHP